MGCEVVTSLLVIKNPEGFWPLCCLSISFYKSALVLVDSQESLNCIDEAETSRRAYGGTGGPVLLRSEARPINAVRADTAPSKQACPRARCSPASR